MESAQTVEVMLADNPGSRLKVPYSIDEPIYNIVQRIAIELQEPKDDYNYQELYLGGFHLEYPQLPLDNYRVLGGTLTYQSFKKGDMSVFVKTLSGKTLCIGCNPSDTILALRKILFKREGVPLAQLRLQYRGRILKDHSTLESKDIGSLSTLTMTTRVRGGDYMGLVEPFQFADVSDRSGVINKKLAHSASPGRTLCAGTNVKVNCPCTDYEVISPVHFGTIEISQAKFICPNCESSDRTVPASVSFYKCKYRFHGLKADGTQFTSGWTVVNQPGYSQTFDRKKQTGWARLVIESAPLNGMDDCPICLQLMDDNVVTLNCGHRFHEFCQYGRGVESCSACELQELLVSGKKYFSGGLRLRLSQ
jgi:hypothetical protein